jgi:hypothetical protein
MPKIEDIIGKSSNENNSKNSSDVAMEGTFSCQTCNLISYEASYDRSKGEIYWTCENKHLSKVNFA